MAGDWPPGVWQSGARWNVALNTVDQVGATVDIEQIALSCFKRGLVVCEVCQTGNSVCCFHFRCLL